MHSARKGGKRTEVWRLEWECLVAAVLQHAEWVWEMAAADNQTGVSMRMFMLLALIMRLSSMTRISDLRHHSSKSDSPCCCLQVSAPASTLLVFRTASLLRSWDCDAGSERTYGNNHIAQLNAKARATMRHHPRWRLMDVEMLTIHSHCSDHLRDSTHLHQHLTWTVLNLYRNMLKRFASTKAHRALKTELSNRLT